MSDEEIIPLDEANNNNGPKKSAKKACNVCQKNFASAAALSRHRQDIHHIDPKKLFVCPLCKESSKNKYFYREHFLKVHEIRMFEETHVFDSYTDFTKWKEAMEARTRTYFIRSRIVNAENRYDEYYNCHRSGAKSNSSASSEAGGDSTTSTKRKPPGQRTKKIGGLCPATIKLNFSGSTHQFVVVHCSTHVGHLLDTDAEMKPRKWKRKRKGSESEESQMSRDEGGGEVLLEEVTEQTVIEEATTNLLQPETEVQLPTTEVDLTNTIDISTIESLINTYGTTTTVDGHYIINVPPDVVIQPNGGGLTAVAATDLTEIPNGTAAFSEVQTSEVIESQHQHDLTSTGQSGQRALLADLLQQPDLTELYRAIVLKINPRNMDYIREKLLEVFGTLETLELLESCTKKEKDKAVTSIAD